NPSSVHPGDKVSLSGTHFAADEQITIQVDGVTVLTLQSDAHGAFSLATYTVPSATAPGTYMVQALGASGDKATATLAVTAAPLPATIALNPSSVHPGDKVSLSGAHFAANEVVRISINGVLVAHASANAGGAFSNLPYTVPSSTAPGNYVVHATGVSSHQDATAVLSVTAVPAPAAIALSLRTVHPGDRVSLSGARFAANDLVLIQINNTVLLSVRADAGGSFANVVYTIPATMRPGTYTVHATSTLSARAASATLVVQPLPPLENGTLIRDTANGRVYLIWNGVRHWIEASTVLDTAGFNRGAIRDYPDSFVLSIPEGAGLTLRQVHGLLDPFSPIASGSAVLRVTPPAAAPGLTIALHGSGYVANEGIQVTFNGSTRLVATDGSGAFTASVTIPATAGVGNVFQVYTYGTRSHVLQVAPLTVINALPAPRISAQPIPVNRGGSVQVSGSGFAAGETIDLYLAANASVATATANGSGAFAGVSVPVPAFLTPGQQTLMAYGVSSRLVAAAQITVTQPPPQPAAITVSPLTANPGSLVLVSGKGFTAREPVHVSFAGKVVLVVTANDAGNFADFGFTLPVSAGAGTFAVIASGVQSGRSAVAGLTVVPFTPSLALSPTSGTPGAQATATGQGFAPNEVVTLALNGQALATTPSTIRTSASGTFSATLVVPATALAGANTLAATGATSRGTATATLSVNLPVQSTWYLAGGSTQPGYDTQVALVNPNGQSASVTFSFMFTSGTPVPYSTTVPANSRATVDVGSIVGAGHDVFTMITADRKIGAEQTIFRAGQDFSTTVGVSAPSNDWYLAEGYTGLTFHEYVRIFNPGTTVANAELRLLPFNGRPATTVAETVAPRSGLIVDVNTIVPGASLSAIVNSDQPVVVDRLITFGSGGYGATEQMGSTTASNTWLFAEGSTVNNFETYLTILNPSTSRQAVVTATFFDLFGNVLGNDTIVVDALHRGNIKVNDTVHSSGIATIVTSNVPVFVERPLYFGSPNGAAAGGSDVFGRNGGGVSWLFPEGNTGGSFREFLLLENPSLETATVRVRFYQPTGQTVDYTVTVPARSRATIDVLRDLPALTPGQQSALVTSTNGVPIIAEQSIYSDNFSKGDGAAGIAQ
ncbi:MAG TPA: hypothetical protein VHB98_17730, partial [Chloroflexota bacterium]|nr:hypothetical protein [Chloroflexota bacterium]